MYGWQVGFVGLLVGCAEVVSAEDLAERAFYDAALEILEPWAECEKAAEYEVRGLNARFADDDCSVFIPDRAANCLEIYRKAYGGEPCVDPLPDDLWCPRYDPWIYRFGEGDCGEV